MSHGYITVPIKAHHGASSRVLPLLWHSDSRPLQDMLALAFHKQTLRTEAPEHGPCLSVYSSTLFTAWPHSKDVNVKMLCISSFVLSRGEA